MIIIIIIIIIITKLSLAEQISKNVLPPNTKLKIGVALRKLSGNDLSHLTGLTPVAYI